MSDYQHNHNKDDDSGLSWFWVIVAFACFWPVGIALLLYKLSQDAKLQDTKRGLLDALEGLGQQKTNGSDKARETQRQAENARQQASQNAREAQRQAENARQQARQNAREAQRQAENARQQARQNAWEAQRQAENARQQAPHRYARDGSVHPSAEGRRSPATLKGGTALSVVGAIVALIFGIVTCSNFLSWMPGYLWEAIQSALLPFIFTGVGVGLFSFGRFRHRQRKRLRRMLSMVGKQKIIHLHQLAEASGTSYSQVCDDIQVLIDGGYLGTNAYINMATGQLFLDSDGFQSTLQSQDPAPAPDQETQLLEEIRQVNNAIPDEEMTRKIARIEECTEHILDYQKNHPETASELHTFLDYYLPTTLKILRSYAELEQQGVQGENISTTKARIEAMMDNVVEGFETQLDKLFEGSMMDISADISVMEKMLSRDGLAGGIKLPKAPTPSESTSDSSSVPYTPTLTLNPNGTGGMALSAQPEEEESE